MEGKLFVVATPIGNMGDISLNGIQALNNSHLILAEDTRVSKVLLNRYKINTPMISYHKYNENYRVDWIVKQWEQGKHISLISDAGTPCISDPGAIIVSHAVKCGVPVMGVPGPSAMITALSISGFSYNSFAFYGFLPRDKSKCKEMWKEVLNNGSDIVILYESPKRIMATISMIGEYLYDSNICLCNDLTKKYERIYRGTASSLLEELRENISYDKGEYTVVIQKNKGFTQDKEQEQSQSLESMLVDIIIKQKVTIKESINILNKNLPNISKKEIYAASLNFKDILQN